MNRPTEPTPYPSEEGNKAPNASPLLRRGRGRVHGPNVRRIGDEASHEPQGKARHSVHPPQYTISAMGSTVRCYGGGVRAVGHRVDHFRRARSDAPYQALRFVAPLLLAVLFSVCLDTARGAGTRNLTVTYDFDTPTIERRDGNARISIAGCQTTQTPGEPCLPFRTARILLPPGYQIQTTAVRVLEEPIVLNPGSPVQWGRMPVSSRERGGPFASGSDLPNAATYESLAACPKERVELISVQQMAGHAIALVRVFPAQYWPVRGQLVFCPRLQVELTLAVAAQWAAGPASRPTPAWARERVRSFVDNEEVLKEYSATEAAAAAAIPAMMPSFDYLLVTTSNLMASFQPLLDQKAADGLSVMTETMDMIQANYPGVDDQEKIRNFIKFAYTNWAVRYVLLGGDHPIVPRRLAYVDPAHLDPDSFIPCDLYYACLDGSWNSNTNGNSKDFWGEPSDGETGGDVDLLGEVYVGRAPVDTVEEANRWVEKTVRHEVIGTPNTTNALFLARYLENGTAQGGDMLDPLLPAFNGAGFQVNWLDDRPFTTFQWTKANAISGLNGSPQVVVYNGHGDYDWIMELFIPDVNMVTNRFPFLLCSVGCNAGEFDNPSFDPKDCIGEEFLKRHDRGAFAALLNTQLGWYNAQDEEQFSGEFQTSFFQHLLTGGHTNLGVANQLSKHDLVGMVETTGTQTYRWCYYEITLFGDPHASLRKPGQNQTSQGTPYWWLASYGWTNNFEAVALADADMDGAVTWREYVAGTSPVNAASVLKLTCTREPGSGCVLQWPSVANRTYSIYRSTNLTLGGFVELTNHLAATPPVNNFTDAEIGAGSAFYKLEVRLGL